MKTLQDLTEMRSKSNIPFGTQYECFFARLEDYYIGKSDGKDRIRAELRDWDKEAQDFIVNELVARISETGIMEFDSNDILSLIQ